MIVRQSLEGFEWGACTSITNEVVVKVQHNPANFLEWWPAVVVIDTDFDLVRPVARFVGFLDDSSSDQVLSIVDTTARPNRCTKHNVRLHKRLANAVGLLAVATSLWSWGCVHWWHDWWRIDWKLICQPLTNGPGHRPSSTAIIGNEELVCGSSIDFSIRCELDNAATIFVLTVGKA